MCERVSVDISRVLQSMSFLASYMHLIWKITSLNMQKKQDRIKEAIRKNTCQVKQVTS